MGSVKLRNLVKQYGTTEVLHKINLEIKEGEFVVLVGPSGCGKSTTLRMIAGLESVTDGEIEIDNKVVNEVAPKDRNIAMVFQNYALYPHMNVFDNMAFGLKIRKTPTEIIKQKVQEAAEILNLTEYLKRKPSQLSGGQRQRVAMGRAIVREPSLFLFDEPLSNLDAKLRNQMRIEIKELHQRVKSTIVYVTHDQVEAMTLGDIIVVMRDGIIEQVGKPLDLFHNPQTLFVAGFIGSPQMNFLKGEFSRIGDNGTIILTNGVTIPYNDSIDEGTKVTLGIRPEDIIKIDIMGSTEWYCEASIDVVEPHGKETFLHLTLNDTKMTMAVDGKGEYSVGEMVKVTFNFDYVHLFDTHTEKRI